MKAARSGLLSTSAWPCGTDPLETQATCVRVEFRTGTADLGCNWKIWHVVGSRRAALSRAGQADLRALDKPGPLGAPGTLDSPL